MRVTNIIRLVGLALSLCAVTPPCAFAERDLSFEAFPNIVAAGVGVTTEWVGARDQYVGIAPFVNIQTEPPTMFSLYGPTALYSFNTQPGWQWGVLASYRFGRKDVQDPVVNLLTPIKGALEGGVTVNYQWRQPSIGYRATSVGVDAVTSFNGTYDGFVITPAVRVWFPVPRVGQVGFGLAASYASGDFMSVYFGVSDEDAQRSGLAPYRPDAGLKDARLWAVIMTPVTRHWVIGGGFIYQRLLDEAANSPIVRDRGDANQWTAGIGAGYAW